MTDDNIWIAAGDGNIERALLSTGISPNIQDQNGYTPLAAAVSYNHIELVEFLLSQGADINFPDHDGDTALHLVETVEMAQKLLDLGADPFLTNSYGKTPALVAFEEQHFDVAMLLSSKTGELIQENNFDDEHNNLTEPTTPKLQLEEGRISLVDIKHAHLNLGEEIVMVDITTSGNRATPENRPS
ncbi:24245_t:CDS:2 [Dentiscutata erythropus]|uniref:24245_t:CDS:1 n=1 Tax=Dentiscutata erythropus TaxID=1348616 RepID=A0A9N8WSC6_9GLOM|nr:24245_t:CDS:2 [Dentiscutata erythropus]